MKRETLLKVFALVIILSFTAGLFTVVFSTPADTQAAVSPTPVPEAFEGIGLATARVTSFGDAVLVRCDAPPADAVERLEAAGLTGVVRGAQLLQARANASLGADDFRAVADAVAASLQPACDAVVARQAFVVFDGTALELANNAGGTARVLVRDVRAYYQLVFRSPPFAFVQPATPANASVRVMVQATLHGGVPDAYLGDRVFIEEQVKLFDELPPATGGNAGGENGAGTGAAESTTGAVETDGNGANGGGGSGGGSVSGIENA